MVGIPPILPFKWLEFQLCGWKSNLAQWNWKLNAGVFCQFSKNHLKKKFCMYKTHGSWYLVGFRTTTATGHHSKLSFCHHVVGFPTTKNCQKVWNVSWHPTNINLSSLKHLQFQGNMGENDWIRRKNIESYHWEKPLPKIKNCSLM